VAVSAIVVCGGAVFKVVLHVTVRCVSVDKKKSLGYVVELTKYLVPHWELWQEIWRNLFFFSNLAAGVAGEMV